MNRTIKSIVLGTALVATTLSSIGIAEARDRYWGEAPRQERRQHRERDAWVGGAAGLAAGLIVGSAIANSGAPVYRERRVYVEPDYYPEPRVYREQRVYREPPRRVVIDTYEPWTRSWFEYCSDRYRSFNPRTGTYRGYDGRDRFCTVDG